MDGVGAWSWGVGGRRPCRETAFGTAWLAAASRMQLLVRACQGGDSGMSKRSCRLVPRRRVFK